MHGIKKHIKKRKGPAKGCVAFNVHWILSTNLKRGSYNLFFPLLIISSKTQERSEINRHPNKCMIRLLASLSVMPLMVERLSIGRGAGTFCVGTMS